MILNLLRVLAHCAPCQVVCREAHETVIAKVLSETLDGKLQLGQTMILG